MESSQGAIETRPGAPPMPFGRSRQRLIDRLIVDRGTTPGKLRSARMILVLGIILAATVATLAGYVRADTTRKIAEHLEPRNVTVTTLYRSLADADATVASAFLSGGAESLELRAQYERDRDLASGSLQQVAAQTGDEPETASLIVDISRGLPVYTGYVERVRANNRQGNAVVGRAYLALASELMTRSILPQAARLQERQAALLDDAYRRAGSAPVVALAAGAVSLGGLVWAQYFVFQRTRRRLNLGLLAASGAVVVGLVWWIAAGAVSASALNSSHRHSETVSGALGPAQIIALRARAIETNRLVFSGGATEEEFTRQIEQISGDLGKAQRLDPGQDDLSTARAAVHDYTVAHARVQDLTKTGQPTEEAVGVAAAKFTVLDRTLSSAVERERLAVRDDIQRAQGWVLTALPVGTGVLAFAAVIGLALGIRQRLEEYR